ncbi:MAG: HK97 gp10 family phage protein [Candidatus Hydrogenedentes bacterium]|nr:HK97 gp10 family phage protein [Candidatus Hydrogenedentota bacterium]
MIDFKIDISEVEALSNAMPRMREILEEELVMAMNETGMLLTTMTAARVPVNFGILRSSIQFPMGFQVRGSPVNVLRGDVQASSLAGAMTSPHEYANYVEFGTRPHWPPAGPIQLWVIRKLQPPADQVDMIVRGVQAKIAREGTPAHRMFKRAWDEGGKSQAERIFKQVPVRAIKRFAGAI